MALNKGQKRQAFDLAVEITKLYANCGDPKFAPDVNLRCLYAEIQVILEDLINTAD